MRCMERLFRRAGLPLGMSQGFHPKPRMTFPLALAVGIEGRNEVMELELTEAPTARELLDRLAPQAPAGLEFLAVEVLPPGARKARVRSVSYQAPIPPSRTPGLEERVARLWAASSCPLPRPGRAPIDVRESLEALDLQDGVLHMRLRTDLPASAGPRDVLSALELSGLEREGVCLTRTEVEIEP
jgi:radical SAM-linked protein